MASKMDYDVLIIGAGMSGLAAGIRLANFEKRVLILEKHNVLGGLNSFYKQAGRLFDVGLHAITNYVPPGTKRAPLTKLLRQLRIRHEEFDLTPQLGSQIWFPGVSLRFENDIATFESEVDEHFPDQIDGLRRLIAHIREDGGTDPFQNPTMARAELKNFLTDPLLTDMLFCPLCFYGSAIEDDMDWGQFKIMFQSLFLEGFARPRKGVRQIIQVLRKKYLALGGELRMKAGVKSLQVGNGAVQEVVLESGEVLCTGKVLSSAGNVETLKLCSDRSLSDLPTPGSLGYVESISCLDIAPKDLGIEDTIIFYSTQKEFAYRAPKEHVDHLSGVICMPSNYAYDEPLADPMIRLTNLANPGRWLKEPDESYGAKKQEFYDRSIAHVVSEGVVPEFRKHITYVDSFTPTTVKRFTSHINGAIYGAPEKVRDGRTHLDNLFLCGTDQGYLGIIGAMLSGISMANMHLLK
jgi:phytoene dehydrogenase-like protein